jgi:hypothetical protein
MVLIKWGQLIFSFPMRALGMRGLR